MSTAIIADIREHISQRIKTASLRELVALATDIPSPGPALSIQPRFELIDDDLVRDNQTGLIWLRDYVPGGKRPWKESVDAANSFELRGMKFRAPTIREQLSIVDYDRHDPAFDTDVFKGDLSWVWTSTPLHSSPSGCAWYVGFYVGIASWNYRSGGGFVRAVRAGP